MGSAIYAHTTIVSSSYRAPHGLCSYNMTSTKGRRKHSRHNTDPKTDNNPATRHESHSRMLQDHTHSGNGDGDRPWIRLQTKVLLSITGMQSLSLRHPIQEWLTNTLRTRTAHISHRSNLENILQQFPYIYAKRSRQSNLTFDPHDGHQL